MDKFIMVLISLVLLLGIATCNVASVVKSEVFRVNTELTQQVQQLQLHIENEERLGNAIDEGMCLKAVEMSCYYADCMRKSIQEMQDRICGEPK